MVADLDTLEGLLAAATSENPAPWQQEKNDETWVLDANGRGAADGCRAAMALLCAAVNSLPALIAELRALRSKL